MEEYIKVSAKTVEDAIIEASIQLGTRRRRHHKRGLRQ